MSQAPVDHILHMIDQLSESDHDLLERELADRAEAQWRKEAEDARRQAKARGINQAAIDDAIREVR